MANRITDCSPVEPEAGVKQPPRGGWRLGEMLAITAMLTLSWLQWTPGGAEHAGAQEPAATSSAEVADERPEGIRDSVERMLDELEPPPSVEPAEAPEPEALPMLTAPADEDVLGPPPGAERPTLRREGEFVIHRRGRVVAAGGGMHRFVFESDDGEAAEPSMVLMPCRLLEDMERLVRRRGDQLVFVVTGQIFVYRQTNYLLPTSMRIAIDRGNLEP